MANRRMLSKSITTSLKLAMVESIEAKLLFTWLIPHCDDDGRIQGDVRVIKGLVFPMETFGCHLVDTWLRELNHVGLLWWYADILTGDKYIQILKWDDHQTIRKDRRTPSKLPSYNKDLHTMSTEWQTDDGHVVDKCRHKLNEVKIREDKISTLVKPAETDPSKPDPEPEKTDSDASNGHVFKRAVSPTKNLIVTAEMHKVFTDAFSRVNYMDEYAKAAGWLQANPQKMKKDLKRFLFNWLAKAEEREKKGESEWL